MVRGLVCSGEVASGWLLASLRFGHHSGRFFLFLFWVVPFCGVRVFVRLVMPSILDVNR